MCEDSLVEEQIGMTRCVELRVSQRVDVIDVLCKFTIPLDSTRTVSLSFRADIP